MPVSNRVTLASGMSWLIDIWEAFGPRPDKVPSEIAIGECGKYGWVVGKITVKTQSLSGGVYFTLRRLEL